MVQRFRRADPSMPWMKWARNPAQLSSRGGLSEFLNHREHRGTQGKRQHSVKPCDPCGGLWWSVCWSMEEPDSGLRFFHARVAQLDHRAIVAQWIAGAELGHGGKDSFQRGRLGCGYFQTRVFEEISHGIFRLGDAVGHQDEAVAGFHLTG